MPDTKDTPAEKFERVIRQTKELKEAEAWRTRLAYEEKLKQELRDPAGLRISGNVTDEQAEGFQQKAPVAQTVCELESPDTINQVLGLQPTIPGRGRPRPLPSLRSSSVTSSSVFELPDDEKHSPSERASVRQIRAELDRARQDICRLEQEVNIKDTQISWLHEQRDYTDRLLLHARCSRVQQNEDVASLERQLKGLRGQIENVLRDRTQAEAALRESRTNEATLMRSLTAARDENNMPLDNLNRRTVLRDNEQRLKSRAKVLRRVSTRRSGPTMVVKTKEEYEIHQPETTGCGCSIM